MGAAPHGRWRAVSRRFELHADAPESTGRLVIAGVGIVAEGIEFGDGTAVVRWREDPPSTCMWGSIAEMGLAQAASRVQIVWVDR